jgi:uncharacterized membrane protein YqgA involved in biofilm formation
MSTSVVTPAMLPRSHDGHLINVAAVLAGSAVGVLVGSRLPERLQHRVLAGLGW